MAVDHSLISKKMWYTLLSSLLLMLSLHGTAAARLNRPWEWDSVIRLPGEPVDEADSDEVGTRWAILVAGSSGYGNYRHQVGLVLTSN